MGIKPSKIETWNEYQDVVQLKPDCMITLGGDGILILNALTFVRKSGPNFGYKSGKTWF